MLNKFFSKKILIIISLVFFFFLFYFLGLTQPLERTVQSISIWTGHQLAKWSSSDQIYQKEELREKIKSLEEQLAAVTIEEAYIKILEEENQKLRNYFNFSKEQDFDTVLSNVIARETSLGLRGQEKNLIIDKGSDDGIKTGFAVLNQAGAIVGKIVSVKEKSSQLCLITASDCRLAVSLLNEESSIGLSRGELGLTVSLDMIPQTEKIELGDIVVSSALSHLIPHGLVIGRVNKVEQQSNEIWQTAIIEPVVSLNNLSILAVVIP